MKNLELMNKILTYFLTKRARKANATQDMCLFAYAGDKVLNPWKGITQQFCSEKDYDYS